MKEYSFCINVIVINPSLSVVCGKCSGCIIKFEKMKMYFSSALPWRDECKV